MNKVIEAIRRGLGLDSDMEAASEFAGSSQSSKGQAGSAEGYQLGPDDGVRVDPMPITAGAEAVIAYTGLLAKAGAESLYLHCGEGPGEWANVRDLPMTMSQDGTWTAQVNVGEGGTFEFCFHDGSGNWDNNSGVNWSVTVHDGGSPH